MERSREYSDGQVLYEPIDRSFSISDHEDDDDDGSIIEREEFSWIEYTAFLFVGMAMLWAW
jgi:hypothetical protein